MARDDPVHSQTASNEDDPLPNLVTVVGRGVPSSFEIAVDGELEMVADDPLEDATIVSKQVAEGTIDVGVRRFRFSGQMANVNLVDWNGVPAPESPSTPTVHVEYGAANR
ncbi:hypothetical protein [Natrarchaeobius chitinivorans]|uniref:Uncharacterized protein n=1 Tax=Natrarchaeobius chitinivorans TaxID=1679083 RepID=A0A3N6PEN5_NATCH|nr:hypothetical protein [Natrarchaeobius chitinivorans]RQG95805.1 hypothetical protein EA473_06335 [Natrarchaeobius chitinivorans]